MKIEIDHPGDLSKDPLVSHLKEMHPDFKDKMRVKVVHSDTPEGDKRVLYPWYSSKQWKKDPVIIWDFKGPPGKHLREEKIMSTPEGIASYHAGVALGHNIIKEAYNKYPRLIQHLEELHAKHHDPRLAGGISPEAKQYVMRFMPTVLQGGVRPDRFYRRKLNDNLVNEFAIQYGRSAAFGGMIPAPIPLLDSISSEAEQNAYEMKSPHHRINPYRHILLYGLHHILKDMYDPAK